MPNNSESHRSDPVSPLVGHAIMKGYAKIALLMGEFPEVAILRRFSALSAQNLLYLQAELRDLERDLREYASADDSSPHPERKVYSLDWLALKNSCDEDAREGNDGSQWETVLALRAKLEEYQIALLRHREINKLSGPMDHHLEFLNQWMKRVSMGSLRLHGSDNKIWSSDEWREDLVSLDAFQDNSPLYHWISSPLLSWYHHRFGFRMNKPRSEEHLAGTVVYKRSIIQGVTRVTTTMLACLLPIVSIVLLYSISSMAKRLLTVTLFTAVFSFALVTATSASVGEIFAATSTYAAVQVVFIGPSDGGNGNCTSS